MFNLEQYKAELKAKASQQFFDEMEELKNSNKSKDEIVQGIRDINNKFEEKLFFISSMERMINEGKKYIYPQQADAWTEFVCNGFTDSWEETKDFALILQTLYNLKNFKKLEDAVLPAFYWPPSGTIVDDYTFEACLAAAKFSKYGPEFLEYGIENFPIFTRGKYSDKKDELRAFIKKQKKLNDEFEGTLKK